ncbi:hypothetical protein PN492_11155 [Dolichospermum circinale CS-537/01]|uniref:Uncharacterized protein n=1 Tax=Dolichospermum circinale CS-537/01 TaxID=3021739 RepID=A0ABT5A581_9CYAN|nr:hypothetical protein [Dolichospermum circinale]MDB9487096.1 hypothetical protein [Dolichospermum circinale CS-537/01]
MTREQGTGNREQVLGNFQGTGNRFWGTFREQGTGFGELSGNREQTGNRELYFSLLMLVFFRLPT